MDKNEKKCLVALNRILNNNNKRVKELLSLTGSAEALFRMGKTELLEQYGKEYKFIQDLTNPNTLRLAQEEIEWANNEGIEILCFSHPELGYPSIMLEHQDYPIVLYKKGDFCLNSNKMISIVGTRRATIYGKTVCRDIVRDIAKIVPNAAIVSGLAYGIDITAHKAALENNLHTVAVLGSGLDNIYPVAHASIATKIQNQGGAIITEFSRQCEGFKINFLQRNRIIAGLSNALIVVESKESGGSMITANIAKHYFTEVFAVPGRLSDPFSAGCNLLISEHNATIYNSALKFALDMNWYAPSNNLNSQDMTLWPQDSEKEKILVALESNNELNIDALFQITEIPALHLSSLLLDLELEGRVISLPGKRYANS